MSSNNKKRRGTQGHQNVPHENRIRVRAKRLDQVDEDKLSLAFWLLAKQLVEDRTEEPTTAPQPDQPDDADPREVAA